MTTPPAPTLPLFPLQSVLFPGALLHLKIFEARYLDLVSECLRDQRPFGVVCLRQGSEVKRDGDAVQLESVGVLAQLLDVDSEQAGILRVKGQGGQRFKVCSTHQENNGLWRGEIEALPADAVLAPPPELVPTVKALASAIGTLKQQGSEPFPEPFRFDDAGWVANRWCELLPISLAAKQKLMELQEPLVRLQLVDEFLRSKGVVG